MPQEVGGAMQWAHWLWAEVFDPTFAFWWRVIATVYRWLTNMNDFLGVGLALSTLAVIYFSPELLRWIGQADAYLVEGYRNTVIVMFAVFLLFTVPATVWKATEQERKRAQLEIESMRRPRLAVYPDVPPTAMRQLPEYVPCETQYLRLSVRNTGLDPVRNCEAYLQSVKVVEAAGASPRLPEDGVLYWGSYQGASTPTSITLNAKRRASLDVAINFRDHSNQDYFAFLLSGPVPSWPLPVGVYEIIIQVSGSNVAPLLVRAKIVYDGSCKLRYEDFSSYPETNSSSTRDDHGAPAPAIQYTAEGRPSRRRSLQ